MKIYKFTCKYSIGMPRVYLCNQRTNATGEYVTLADYQALEREAADLRRRLEIALEIAERANNELARRS